MNRKSLKEEIEASPPRALDSQYSYEDSVRNPLGSSASKNIPIHLMPSFSLYDEGNETGGKAVGATMEGQDNADHDKTHNRGFLIGTVVAMALVISVGVVTVGLVGFLPLHLIGFRAISGTGELIQMEAVRGVVILMRSTILQLPDFSHTVTANYMRNQTSAYTEDALPSDSKSLMYSLLSVLSTFKGTISFFKFSYEKGLYGIASEPLWMDEHERNMLLGGHSMTKEETEVYMYDPIALQILSTNPFGGWNIPIDMKRPEGAFEMIVRPWEQNGSTRRWLPEGLNRTGLYFNFVIPFRIHGASGNCEVGMPTHHLLRESQPLIRALRKHGRVMLFDDERGIVILNSWGEPVSWWSGNTSAPLNFGHLMLSDIKDPLAASLVRQLKGQKFDVNNDLESVTELSFPFENSDVRASVARVTDSNGLNIMLSVAVLRSDFFSAIVRVRTIILIVVSVIFVVSAVVALVGACYLVKPLTHLVEALKKVSNLEISSKDSKRLSRSRILEVGEIQADYVKLLRQVLVLRKFVPEAILARVDPPSDGNASIATEIQSTCEHATLFLDDEENCAPHMVSTSMKREIRLNSGIFKEHLNQFLPKRCSVVAVEIHAPKLWEDSKRYMSIFIATATEFGGCIEVLGPEKGLVSFGAHTTVPMHSTRGCRFAFELFAKLSPQEREAVTMVVESNEFLVGTCGAHSRNARVLFGSGYLFELTRAMSEACCHIAATSGIASQVQGFEAFPVDCVLISCSSVPIVLFELRLRKVFGSFLMSAVKQFRLGFAAMRQGYYKQAIAHYRRVRKSDLQCQRLIRLCAQRCANKDTTPYLHMAVNSYNIDSDFAGAALEKLIESAPDAVIKSSEHKSFQAFEEDENGSIGGNSMPLFDMYRSSSSDSLQTCDEGCNGADDVPLFLTDLNQVVWARSLKKISEGAFSAVYLGLSEGGLQVAIKCIPRRRRDIMQESLEAEMNVASKLRHANIVQYVSCSIVQSHLAIIMEYVPGGSLYAVIKSFGRVSPLVARRFTVDILNGLNYLHGIGIVHCDVKPHNVLLGMDGVCKLSDFGSTISEAADMARTMADEVMLRGTALYMAPEVAAGGRCTPQSDIYSLGISLLEMLLGRLPWRWSSKAPEGSDMTSLHMILNRDTLFVQNLARGHLEPEIPEQLGREAAFFVAACCHINPAMRPSALSLLSYAFIL